MFLKQPVVFWMTCGLSLATSVAEPLAGGLSDKDEDVMKLASRLENAFGELAAIKTRLGLIQCSIRVGFTLTLDVNLTVQPEEIVKFDYIMYNEGQGYDPATGYFTAPVGGMYLLFVQAETPSGAGFGLSLIKEGEEWAYISGNSDNSRLTLFDEVVLNLDQGQRVWILKRDNSNPVIRHRSNFGGFLIAPDQRQCKLP